MPFPQEKSGVLIMDSPREKKLSRNHFSSTIQGTGKYRVTVKDFSAGRGFPSVGVIVENISQRTYRLNVGCDTCFQVALSRCLTEVFQGLSGEEVPDQRLLQIPDEELLCFQQDDAESLYNRYVTFSQFTKDNSGVFPPSLFRDDPSYEFNPSVFITRPTYRDEVQALLAFFHGQGTASGTLSPSSSTVVDRRPLPGC
jgi:ribosomal protein S12 methylthiotransferase accessory factor YcaO